MATPSQRNWGRAEILGSGIRLVGGPRGWQLKERDFRTMGSTQELCLPRMLEELISSPWFQLYFSIPHSCWEDGGSPGGLIERTLSIQPIPLLPTAHWVLELRGDNSGQKLGLLSTRGDLGPG